MARHRTEPVGCKKSDANFPLAATLPGASAPVHHFVRVIVALKFASTIVVVIVGSPNNSGLSRNRRSNGMNSSPTVPAGVPQYETRSDESIIARLRAMSTATTFAQVPSSARSPGQRGPCADTAEDAAASNKNAVTEDFIRLTARSMVRPFRISSKANMRRQSACPAGIMQAGWQQRLLQNGLNGKSKILDHRW